MSKYKDLQKYISEYFSNKTKKELENELFYENPELFNEIAKYRQYGIPKRYKDAVKKYNVDPHMFFFESNLARQYTGNPRYIYERMVELYPNYTFIWSYEGTGKIPGNPIIVTRGSDEYYEYRAKSKFLINNTLFPLWYPRKESIYIQTWHGTPYKHLHWDRDTLKRPSTPDFYAKSTGWSVLLSPNHFSTEKFKSAFKYKGKILETGYPANDIFYDSKRYNKKRKEIRAKLGLKDDTITYLYAPTWRSGNIGESLSKFKFKLLFNPDKFLESSPNNSVLLIRSHHMSVSDEELSHLNGNAIDVSGYDDAIELMCAADILITDYSSIVFDWYCSKKPVIYYVPDLESYENTRGVYFDITEKNCGIICKTEEELYNNLDIEKNDFYKEFYKEFCSLHNGHSTDKVIDYIMKTNKTSYKTKMKKYMKKFNKFFN